MKNLRLIVNLGAGVDSLVGRGDLPAEVPITRLTDPNMARMMAGYVLFAALRYARDIPYFEAAQRRGEWAYRHPRSPETVRVAVLGLGELGACAAQELDRVPRRHGGAGDRTVARRHPGGDASAYAADAWSVGQ
ncbi:hypothetical protein G6F31_019213 [Rhizopus arrhizus]|nr:hypothetical protein G6F31_019213 [Rhizopus arrhizus]